MDNADLEHLIEQQIKESQRINELNKKKSVDFQKKVQEQKDLIREKSDKYRHYS